MKKVAVGLMAILAGIITVTGAYGDEFKIIPSVSVREEYDDNVFYTSSDEKDDFITTAAAMLELSQRTERLNLNLVKPLELNPSSTNNRFGADQGKSFFGDGHTASASRYDRMGRMYGPNP